MNGCELNILELTKTKIYFRFFGVSRSEGKEKEEGRREQTRTEKKSKAKMRK